MDNSEAIAKKVRELYRIVDELEALYPGRRFTLDGHLVGSIGEVLVAWMYDLTLLPASLEAHDAVAGDQHQVQIKATQINRISLSSEPDHLIALSISPSGAAEEIYNGLGYIAWNACGKVQKNGQRSVSLNRLRRLMEDMPSAWMIKRRAEV